MKYKSGYRYVTTSEEVELLGVWASPIACRPICIDESSRLRIMPGYAWDGASFWPFLLFGTPKPSASPSLSPTAGRRRYDATHISINPPPLSWRGAG